MYVNFWPNGSVLFQALRKILDDGAASRNESRVPMALSQICPVESPLPRADADSPSRNHTKIYP